MTIATKSFKELPVDEWPPELSCFAAVELAGLYDHFDIKARTELPISPRWCAEHPDYLALLDEDTGKIHLSIKHVYLPHPRREIVRSLAEEVARFKQVQTGQRFSESAAARAAEQFAESYDERPETKALAAIEADIWFTRMKTRASQLLRAAMISLRAPFALPVDIPDAGTLVTAESAKAAQPQSRPTDFKEAIPDFYAERATKRAWTLAIQKLGTKSPPHLRWFRGPLERCSGQFLPDVGEIWISTGLSPTESAKCLAHELKHHRDWEQGEPCGDAIGEGRARGFESYIAGELRREGVIA